jgi:glycosyltransferase involved in cell wall biosynthesis
MFDSDPLLTIGIPTLDRHRFLRRAIDSCLRQTVPTQVIVADQGHLDETAQIIASYPPSQVRHVKTDATTLWDNWKACAKACETVYFSWLQDDDIVSPSVRRANGTEVPGTGFAHRVCAAFDEFPAALHWQGRLYCGVCHEDGTLDDVMASWWGQSGPWVLMPIIKQRPLQWPGEILVPTSYLTSWSLSPAVAFRCGEKFTAALDYLPTDADLYAERLIVAALGMQGPFIADPVVAGYWIHHGQNESYKQHAVQEKQKAVAIEFLDELMRHTDWKEVFRQWCLVMNPMQIMGFGNDFQMEASVYATELKDVMAQSIKGRVEVATDPTKPVAKSEPQSAHEAPDQDVLYLPEETYTSRLVYGNAG